MKKLPSILIIIGLSVTLITSVAFAQSTNQLSLGLNRDFGYGGFGNDIQGLFTMKINNPPANLTKVEFFIDSKLMGEDTQAPFSLQFNTDSYSLGNHSLSATGYNADGSQIQSNILQMQFVPASASTKTILRIIVPIIVIIGLIAVVSIGLPLILNKGKLAQLPPGSERKYGIGGGAICPKCGRPFPLKLWFINMGLNKIDRCPYCGKWSLVRPRSLAELRQAEADELTASKSGPTISSETEEEKLRKELDDSRFQNM